MYVRMLPHFLRESNIRCDFGLAKHVGRDWTAIVVACVYVLTEMLTELEVVHKFESKLHHA